MSPCVLSCWHPRHTSSSSYMRKIETLMERGILLCELLLCSFLNGEKFNYQLICCFVSGDMKFPIVSAPIKCSALTPLFRHWEQRTQVGTVYFWAFCLMSYISTHNTPCVQKLYWHFLGNKAAFIVTKFRIPFWVLTLVMTGGEMKLDLFLCLFIYFFVYQ